MLRKAGILLLVHFTQVSTKCDDSWPNIDFILPVSLEIGNKRNDEWHKLFLHTLKIFWPVQSAQSKVIVVLDEKLQGSQLERDHVYSITNKTENSFVQVAYHKPPMNYFNERFRQQHLMFYADIYSSEEYVALVETDCIFHSVVDVKDILLVDRPVVQGRIGSYSHLRDTGAPTTHKVLNMDEAMSCNSYFPIVVKTDHFRDLREHVSTTHHMSFDDVFTNIITTHKGTQYSQFNIICTYLFWTKRDEYAWYLADQSPEWNGYNPKPETGLWADKRTFDKSMLTAKPRIATHEHFRTTNEIQLFPNDSEYQSINFDKFLLQGACHSSQMRRVVSQLVNCSKYLVSEPYYKEMFAFENQAHHAKFEEKLAAYKAKYQRGLGCSVSAFASNEFLTHFASQGYDKEKCESILYG